MKLRITPIKVTRGLFADVRAVERAVENALSAAALGVKADFSVTTQTWKRKPRFLIQRSKGERLIYTDSEIYGFVDLGTRPHIIRARRGRVLAFKSRYRAKTSPRTIGSSVGGASGESVFARQVRHPGTDAREFSKTIKAKWDKELPEIMQRAIDAEVE